MSEKFRLATLLALILVVLACRQSSISPPPALEATAALPLLPLTLTEPAPTPQPTGVPTLPARNDRAAALIERVSAERLYEHVVSLSAINSRHVNSATIAQAAEYIHRQFRLAGVGGNLMVEYDEFPLQWNTPTTQRNVIATLPGSDPDARIIVVGAHYDSRTYDVDDPNSVAPGANDNASGTAVVMELARVLANETPHATIIFVAFSAEEVGKAGSTHFVEQAASRGDSIRAMLALDIVGNAVGPAGEGSIRAFSADPPASRSRQLARLVALHGEDYLEPFDVLVQPAVDRPHRYSDHVPFSDAGIPAMRLIETIEDTSRQHSPLDRPEHLSPFYMRSAAQIALATLANLAWGPDAPPVPTLSGDVLSWSPVEGAAGYAVALRRLDGLEFEVAIRTREPLLVLDRNLYAGYGFTSVSAIGPDGAMSLFSQELPICAVKTCQTNQP